MSCSLPLQFVPRNYLRPGLCLFVALIVGSFTASARAQQDAVAAPASSDSAKLILTPDTPVVVVPDADTPPAAVAPVGTTPPATPAEATPPAVENAIKRPTADKYVPQKINMEIRTNPDGLVAFNIIGQPWEAVLQWLSDASANAD